MSGCTITSFEQLLVEPELLAAPRLELLHFNGQFFLLSRKHFDLFTRIAIIYRDLIFLLQSYFKIVWQ